MAVAFTWCSTEASTGARRRDPVSLSCFLRILATAGKRETEWAVCVRREEESLVHLAGHQVLRMPRRTARLVPQPSLALPAA